MPPKKSSSRKLSTKMKQSEKANHKKVNGVVLKSFPGYFLLACIAVTFYFLLQVFWPFITILIFSAILSTAFYPNYLRILKLFNGRKRLASIVTCILVFFLILIPFVVFIILLGKEAVDTFTYIQDHVMSGVFDPYLKWESGGYIYDSLGMIRGQIENIVDIDSINIKDSITESAKTVTSFLVAQSANILKGFSGLLISIFILLFSMYYFYKDADLIMKKLMVLSPLPVRHEIQLFKKFKQISHAALYGIFLTSVTQGIIGGIGFAFVGIPNALFWGTAIALFSLVPIIGTATIWFPASMILLASGNLTGGIMLFLWGLLIVSTVDNFLRAYLIGEKANMNQLLTFLAVFGGIIAFGLVGVIFGPLILTLFFTFLHIYEKEYDKVLHPK